jgi:hypothetical protein
LTNNSQNFLRDLGAVVAAELGPEFSFSKSKLELKRKVLEGHDVVILSGSSKHSPFVNVAFYYGKNFAVARSLEKATCAYAFPYHIQQFSPNWRSESAETHRAGGSWSIDINNPPPDLARQLVEAVHAIAFPFFARFSSLVVARNALATDDPDCFGGAVFWRQLLRLDAALGDLVHFQQWSQCLDEWTRSQAEAEIAKFSLVAKRASVRSRRR